MLSVIIPAYNEEAMLPRTTATIHHLLQEAGIAHELIFVDDGSKDGTWEQIQLACEAYSVVRGLHFSRNFGKEAAIYAGLSHAQGDCCVVIDCDLQHPPEKIIEMYHLWETGFEVVEAVKSDRGQESVIHALCAKLFYRLMSGATKIDMRHASDFKLLDRQAVHALLTMQERNGFFRALSSWIGFRTTQITFEVQERTAGESKWSVRSLVKYAITNVTAFSTAPMQIVTVLGTVMLLVSLGMGGISLVQKFTGQALEGFTTVIVLLLFASSLMMMSLGIIGYYIAKIYEEVQERPKFIISKTCGGTQYATKTP